MSKLELDLLEALTRLLPYAESEAHTVKNCVGEHAAKEVWNAIDAAKNVILSMRVENTKRRA